MTEINEPLRLLFVIETQPEVILSIMERNPGYRPAHTQLLGADRHTRPPTHTHPLYHRGRFVPYTEAAMSSR